MSTAANVPVQTSAKRFFELVARQLAIDHPGRFSAERAPENIASGLRARN